MPKGPPITEVQKVAVAILLAEEHPSSQQDVAARLGISPAAVSRARAEMLDRKILIERGLEFQEATVASEILETALALARPRSPLRETLQSVYSRAGIEAPAPDVYVVPETSAPAERVAFNEQAARHVRDMLQAGAPKHVGVAWGPSVAGVLDGLLAYGSVLAPEGQGSPKLRVVPLSGDPIGKSLSLSSSNLAERLTAYLVPDPADRKLLSLSSIPAFIPRKDFSDDERRALRKFISLSDDYGEIFGSEGQRRPLVDRLDVVLTGVSRRDEPLGYSAQDLLRTTGIEPADLQSVAVGDIGGVFLRRRKSRGQSTLLDEIERDHWTGVKKSHLRGCADRARSSKERSAGVIVVASGAQKAECVMTAVGERLVNHLVIDSALEAALLPLAKRWEIEDRA